MARVTRVQIGTSGWVYPDWRGTFYPRDLPTSSWLDHYVHDFSTVEINSTFYRLPATATFRSWRERTPEGFSFAVKASRYLTHIRRLREPREPVERLVSRTRGLGTRLGPILIQLPPTLRRDLDALERTLHSFGRGRRLALEFRHPSWATPATMDLLERYGVAWVVGDRAGVDTPVVTTGGWAYLRFHKGTDEGFDYPKDALRRWAEEIMSLDVSEVFAYFNNDPGGAAPRDARALAELLSDAGAVV